jgi:6-pyruvoyl-tetrahydropterin synthase-like protein
LSQRQWDAAATALLWVAIAGCAVVWLSAATPLSYALFRWIPNGYNEGWNAYWAEVAWHGGALYPAVNGPISNNYPPLSFYIVGAVGALLGDNIFAGRLLAFLSLIVVAVDVFVWLRIGAVSRAVAAFGATLFLAAFATYAPAYMTMNDPQLLAHAFMMTSVVVLWRWDFSRKALVGAAVLMILAGTIKHLLIALPLTVTIWMAQYRAQRLVTWVLSATAVLLVAVALLYFTQGAVFFSDMASSRLYLRSLVESGIRRVWQSFGFLAALGGVAVLAFLSRRSSRGMREQAAFVLAYFAISAAIGALAASGKGVDRNAFFDFLIAASLAVAVGVEHVRTRMASPGSLSTGYQPGVAPTPRWFYPMMGSGIAAGCCAVFLIAAAHQWPARWHLMQQTDEREAAEINVIRDIRNLGGGAAACEELSLCYWAGSAFKVDFFNYGQKLATSALPPTDCDETFSARRISLVQVNSPRGESRLSFRLPPSCNTAIAREYSLDIKSSHGRLMLPAVD